MLQWLVQLGPFGQVGRFRATDAPTLGRGDMAICRTSRGLEVGRLLNSIDEEPTADEDGQLLRRMSSQDQMVWERICRHRDRAFNACTELLREKKLNATLMEVESLFDGNTLYFYFLGPVDAEVEALTRDLAETYESKVQFRRFAERLAEGCGPGCGTDASENGCASGACGSCGLAGACSSKASAE